MIYVAKSVGATVANGALTLVVQDVNGLLIDVFAASFQILDASGGTVQTKTALDMTANRLGVGRYAAAWNASTTAVGQYAVRWFYTLTSVSTEQTFDQEFEVVAKPYATVPYCAVYDLRSEGVTTSQGDDATVQRWIARASKYVEQFTGQVFAPVYKTLAISGRGGRAVLLGEPIVALESAFIDYFTISGASSNIVTGDTLRVFNRHLKGMVNPDDRANPKIEFIHGPDLGGLASDFDTGSSFILSQLVFPVGTKNVQLTGVFGYTEADGSFTGQTPFLIREVAKMLVVRLMPQMIDQDGRAESGQRDRLIQENTRDQGFQLAAPWLKGGLTGFWDVDSILVDFRRPPAMGAA